MEERNFKLAMGQMLVEGGKPDQNMGRAEAMIRRAAEQGAEVVVLPECLDLGWTHPSARQLAEPIPGPHTDQLGRVAGQTGLFVVAGLTEKDGERIYNAAVLVSPEGEILLKHRKINVLTIAQDVYATGGSLAVAETPLGTIGVDICADNFASSLVLGHSLARMGAQMILSPSAWAVVADHDNEQDPYGEQWRVPYTTLARLYDITAVGVSNVGWLTAGAWKGRKCIGCSLAVGPGGNVIAQGPYGDSAESLIMVDVEVVPPSATGTAICGMLKERGYQGP